MYCLQACMCAPFSPGEFTGWGSEGVKEVGTQPLRSNLHASLITLSTTVRRNVPKTNTLRTFNLLDNRRTAVVHVIYCVQSPLLQGRRGRGGKNVVNQCLEFAHGRVKVSKHAA